MQTPKLYPINAYDAAYDKELEFSWNGNQAFGSKIEIYENGSSVITYTNSVTSMRLRHAIPAKSLVNGKCWYAVLYVLDENGSIISEKSNSVTFYCFTTPALQFRTASQNLVIKNSVYQASLTYTQIENEPLEQYQINLCDLSKNILQTSGIKYDNDLTAQLSGMSDNARYYLHATGQTQHGMDVETDYILVNIEYIRPSLFAIVNLENIGSKGLIKIESNMIQIEGYSTPDPPEYMDNSMVDLTNTGAKVGFSKGFSFSDNFSLGITYKGAKKDLSVLQWEDGTYHAYLIYREGQYRSNGNVLKGYYELRVDFPLGQAIYISRYIPPIQQDKIYTVWIRKIDDIYSVELGSEVG